MLQFMIEHPDVGYGAHMDAVKIYYSMGDSVVLTWISEWGLNEPDANILRSRSLTGM